MAAAGNSELLHVGRVEFSWYKPDEKRITANGTAEHDSKMDVAATEETLHPVEAGTPEMADEEDLDRWT